jgi:hypothetical protein
VRAGTATKLTREHFITDDVLGAISADGKVVVVEGAAWQDKTERRKVIGRASLLLRQTLGVSRGLVKVAI